MRFRELVKRLAKHGYYLKQGKGDHLKIVNKDGKYIGLCTLRAGHAEVGPGTVIAFERRLGIDLDDINPRKPKPLKEKK